MRWGRSWSTLAHTNQPQQNLFSRIAHLLWMNCVTAAQTAVQHMHIHFIRMDRKMVTVFMYFVWFFCSAVSVHVDGILVSCRVEDIFARCVSMERHDNHEAGASSHVHRSEERKFILGIGPIDAYVHWSSGQIVAKIKHLQKRDRIDEGKDRIQVKTEHNFLFTFLLVKISVLCCHKHTQTDRQTDWVASERWKGLYSYGLWTQRAEESGRVEATEKTPVFYHHRRISHIQMRQDARRKLMRLNYYYFHSPGDVKVSTDHEIWRTRWSLV